MTRFALRLMLALPAEAGVFGCSSSRPQAVARNSAPDARPPPPTGRPVSTPPSNVADPAALLRELGSDASLRLTTDRNSAAARFHFLSRIVTRAGGVERVAHVMVVRNEARVAMLCTSAGGLPYCYATRGFFVSLDPARAGGLIVFEGGSPRFALSAAPGGGRLIYQFAYASQDSAPSIELDLAALVRGVRERLRSAVFDRQQRTIDARTDNAVVQIVLADRHPGTRTFPLTDFLTQSLRTGDAVMVVGIATDAAPPFDIDAVTEASVRRLGLRVRKLTADDVRTIDLMVPADFGKNPAEARAAGRLRELVDPVSPNRRPVLRAEVTDQQRR